MTMLFYCADPASLPEPEPMPPEVRIRFWRPACDGLPPDGPRRIENGIWWLFERIDAFARYDFEEVTLWRGGRAIHRLVITPRWYRFPFMGPRDLQLGALWTAPQARGRGIARVALAHASCHAAKRADRLWYVVDAGNCHSIALLKSSGYRLVGEGRRTAPLGCRPLGRFRLDRPHLPRAG